MNARLRTGFVIVSIFLLSGCAAHQLRIRSDHLVFDLHAPQAKVVKLHLSANGFRPTAGKPIFGGRWRFVTPRSEDLRYFYTVDGHFYIPDCPLTEKDDYGSNNCIFNARPTTTRYLPQLAGGRK